MKYAINLPNFGPGMNPETILGWARTAERLGYDLVLVSDHLALTPDANARSPEPFYEAFTTLAWLAGQTDRIELGTGVVIMPHRHPVQLARMASTLDQLAHGRLILGVGVGWARLGYEALGIPFDRRGRTTDDYLRALRVLWDSSKASYHGESIEFHEIHTAPRPARIPHPPIWVGGNSPAAIRRAVQYGDAWHPLWPQIAWLRLAVQAMREFAGELERPVPSLCPRIQVAITESPLPEDRRATGHGSLEQIQKDIHALAELDAQYVVLDTDPGDQRFRRSPDQDWRTLEALASILPRRAAGGSETRSVDVTSTSARP